MGINFNNAQQLKRAHMKKIMGGSPDTTFTICSVMCGTAETTRNCGMGVSCITGGNTITCGGSDCKDVCTGKACVVA